MGSKTILPIFKIEKSAKKNFDKYMKFMNQPDLSMDDLRRGRWAYEMYLKSCSIAEKERKQQEKENPQGIVFEDEGQV